MVIPNWNGLRRLPACVDALNRQTDADFETVLVDNGSTDGSLSWLKANHPGIRILEMGRNTGFAAAVNAGMRSSCAPFLALLNTDAVPAPDWLCMLKSALAASDPMTGAVAGKMLQTNNPSLVENAGDVLSWQGAAEKRGHGRPAGEFAEPGEIFSCCAGGALYRREFLDAAGLFDERFFAYLEDIDLCLRGRLMGFRFIYEPRATLLHQGHGSAMPAPRYIRLTTANRLRIFAKNIPAALLWRRLPSLLYGQWYHLVCGRRPLASAMGYADFLMDLPHVIRQRRAMLNATKLSSGQLDALLAGRMLQPGLIQGLLNRMRKREHS